MKSKLPIVIIFLLILITGIALYFAFKKNSSESYSTCMSYNPGKMNGKKFFLFEWPGAITNGKVDGNNILLKFDKDEFYFSDNKEYTPMQGDGSHFKYHITSNQHNIVSGYNIMIQKNPPGLWQTFSYFEETGILVLVGRNAMTLTFVDVEKFPYYFYTVNKDNTVDVYCKSGSVNKYTNFDKNKTTIYDIKSAC